MSDRLLRRIARAGREALAGAQDSWKAAFFRPRTLSRPIEVAIIGSGKAASYHLDTLKHIENLRVSCIVNRGRTDPRPLMAKHHIPAHYTSVAEALEAGQFEAAIIAVPPGTTSAVTSALIQKGIRCLVEKPLSLSTREAAPFTKLESPSLHAVAYNRRFYSCILHALQITQCLGTPYSMHIDAAEDVFKILKASGEEALRVRLVANTTHALDLFTLFLGRSIETKALYVQRKLEDIPIGFQTGTRFENGSTATFVSHGMSPGDWLIFLYGHGYRLTINLSRNQCVLRHGKESRAFRRNVGDRIAKEGVFLQAWAFFEAVAKDAPSPAPLCSFDEAYQTLKLAESILSATHSIAR